MKHEDTLIIILAFLVLIVSLFYGQMFYGQNKPNESEFNYSFGPCLGAQFRYPGNGSCNLLYSYSNGRLDVYYVVNYVCCANMTASESVEGNDIKIFLANKGEMCKCICNYPLKFSLKIPEGIYNLTFYGVEFRGKYKDDVMMSKVIDTENPVECMSDEDCVHAQSCCHKKSQMCVPFYMFEEKNCSGVFCTENCEECTSCSCVNGKCVTKNVGGCC